MGRSVVRNISQLSYQRHQPIKMDTGPVRMYTSCKELVLVLTCTAQVSALLVGECADTKATLLMSTYHVLDSGDALET